MKKVVVSSMSANTPIGQTEHEFEYFGSILAVLCEDLFQFKCSAQKLMAHTASANLQGFSRLRSYFYFSPTACSANRQSAVINTSLLFRRWS